MKKIFLLVIVFISYLILSIPINSYVERAWLCRPKDFGIGLPMFKYWIHLDGDIQHGSYPSCLIVNMIIVMIITLIIDFTRKKIK